MAEIARLSALLRASAAQNADRNKVADQQPVSFAPNEPAPVKPIPLELLERLTHATENCLPPPEDHFGNQVKVDLEQVLQALNNTLPRDNPGLFDAFKACNVRKHAIDKIVLGTCKRIARADEEKLEDLAAQFGHLPSPTEDMAGRFPVLSTSNLPRATAEEQSATASPARGTAMLNSIFKSVRVPEFRHKWLFWAEKGQQSTPKDKTANSEEYASRPKPLGDQIISIKEFYQHFNNIPVENLKLRDSIHLFHYGVKPVWEDPRNAKGGAWYFKISKDISAEFWHEICLLAVGDILQGAIETKRDCKYNFSPTQLESAANSLLQHSTTTSAASPTAYAGMPFKLPFGPAMRRTRLDARSFLLPFWSS